MNELRLSLVQTSLQWHEPEQNRVLLAEKMASLKDQTDIVVLPEMFTSGFTNQPEDLSHGSATIEWLLEQAKQLGAAITGSIACKTRATDTDIQYVNRLLFVTPKGEVQHYDKVHLFRMAGEHKRYQPGRQRCIITYKGWRLLATVCYDLRFPVFCRNTCSQEGQFEYDVMLCVANWPEARRHHWRTLLQARAIENQAYVVGVNRIGRDGNGLDYSGDSLAINFYGDLLIDSPNEWVQTVTVNQQTLMEYRQAFPAWQDADEFSLRLKGASE